MVYRYLFWTTRAISRHDNDMTIYIIMGGVRACGRVESIRAIIKARDPPDASIGALIGRVGLAKTTTFDRFSRGALKPPEVKMNANRYVSY